MTGFRQAATFAGVACAWLAVASGGAFGQATQQPAPQQTTATYEDWTLRCAVQPGPPVQKTCEIVQSTHVQGQAAVLTQIAIGGQKNAFKVVIQLPIDVWLPANVKLVVGDKDPGLIATFKRCVPQACFADVEFKEDTAKKFKSTEPGKLQFKDANQKDLSLPVSFKGFDAAYDALIKN